MSENTLPLPPKPEHFSPTIRRIINAHGADGKVVQTESQLNFIQSPTWGIQAAPIWKTTETPSKDNNTPADFDAATRASSADRFAGLVSPNGTSIAVADLAPGAKIGQHRTSSVDYIILLSGSILLIAPTGEESVVNTGDVVVLKGSRHAWRNPGPEWARWVAILVDAEPATVNGKVLPEGVEE